MMEFISKKIVIPILILLTSCDSVNEARLQSSSAITHSSTKVVPFRYVKKLVVVDAYLNDSNRVNSFILDTGAFQSKVEYNLAEKLKLETIFKRDNGTAQGIKREIEITSVDSIRLTGSTFVSIGAGKLKYDAMSYSPCVAKDGIIGANLMKLAHWKINYDKQEMEISQTPFSVNADKKHYNLDFTSSFLSGVPKIDIEIDGKIIEDVIIDLGYNGGLIVPYKFANKFHSENSKTIIDQSTTGIFGSNRDTLLVKELNVKLGAYSTKIPVEFSSLNKALLGNDFLEHFTVYIDYDNDKIILEPKSKVKIDKTKTFIPGILNDSLWIVNRTNPNLALKIGDTLKTINGYQPRDLFQSHCDYFLKISEFLKSDKLHIEDNYGNKINLSLNQ